MCIYVTEDIANLNDNHSITVHSSQYIFVLSGKAEKEDGKIIKPLFSLPFYLKGQQAIEVYNERMFGMSI